MTLNSVIQSRDKNSLNDEKIFKKFLISAKIDVCQKDAFYAFLFVSSGRFGDLYGRPGDSVCIQETPGKSGRVGIDDVEQGIISCAISFQKSGF